MTPGQIKALIIFLLTVGVAAGGFFAVAAYNNAITAKAELEKQVLQYQEAAKSAAETIRELKEDRARDSAALAAKNAETAAHVAVLAKTTKELQDALADLPEADRACAGRTVPGAVDRVLSKGNR